MLKLHERPPWPKQSVMEFPPPEWKEHAKLRSTTDYSRLANVASLEHIFVGNVPRCVHVSVAKENAALEDAVPFEELEFSLDSSCLKSV